MILFQEQAEQDRLIREKIAAVNKKTKQLKEIYGNTNTLRSLADAWRTIPDSWGL